MDGRPLDIRPGDPVAGRAPDSTAPHGDAPDSAAPDRTAPDRTAPDRTAPDSALADVAPEPLLEPLLVPSDARPAGLLDRVWTVPNALSLLRLLGVPLFLWLLVDRRDGLAVLVLMVSGVTDYVDGYLARRLGQTSRLGELLDPAVDRLYILAALAGLAYRGVIPVLLVALLVGRDVVLAAALPVLRRHGHGPLPVSYLGKAATLNLLYAFPLLLLGDGSGTFATVCGVLGWAFTIWGTSLYWWAGVLYLAQVRSIVTHAGRRPQSIEEART